MYPKRWRTIEDDEAEGEDGDYDSLNFDTSKYLKRDPGSSSHDPFEGFRTTILNYQRQPSTTPQTRLLQGTTQPPAAPVPKCNREIENEQRVAIYNASKEFLTPSRIVQLRSSAQRNLDYHYKQASPNPLPITLFVVAEDTLNAAQELTVMYGQRFAVLNMANAFTIGGGYLKGASAQEENLFRRTTIPTEILQAHRYSKDPRRYTQAASDIIEAKTGFVYIPDTPSVCFRSSEIHSKGNVQGYEFLADDRIFDFWELRSSAIDAKRMNLNSKGYSVVNSMRLRIRSQLITLIDRQIKHVVLSAFGCGAFGNDAETVARIYAQELRLLLPHFQVVAFAIFYAGINRENYDMFRRVMTSFFGNTIPVYNSFSFTTEDDEDEELFEEENEFEDVVNFA